ncbi:MAG: TrkA C-terminal domain-containing protein [Actinomycetaceae bacterium]|nr:TrkA C-terminal domain-containing protein [Actinomycetaceae bacterium]
MTGVMEYLHELPVLFTFLLIGVGMMLGHIKIKGVSLGAAAVLFLAIAVSALGDHLGVDMTIPDHIGIVGLALFAFAIGNNSGNSFFRSLKQATGPILSMVVILCVAAGAAFALGRLVFGWDSALIAGTFAGGITNTPALTAASEASGNASLATVGYAVAYLFGVIGMIIAAQFALRRASSDTDKPEPVTHFNVRVERDDNPTVAQVETELGGPIEISRLRRGETGPIWIPKDTDVLEKDDLVTIVGTIENVNDALDHLGHRSSHSLRSDRRYLDFRRITVSDPDLAGKTVEELDEILDERWHAKISRVRRGDNDMLAIPELMVEMGDRVRVVGPTMKLKEISKWLGDSAKGLTYINPIALGLGLALGYVIGEIPFPLPGGGEFSLGYTAGILIVGLIMGKAGRIGPLVTSLPNSVNAVLAELGLLMFLARAGTTAGSEILEAFSGGDWWKILIVGAMITSIVAVGIYWTMRRVFKMGGTKLSGLLGGVQTQPAVLAFANGRTEADPRVALGYALVYPVAMIVKILLAHVLGSL